ncbi:hypothetical protein [Macrococcus capreoli]|uniref:hypothetical protein n=1 Tax=Macrococcus capreoli TaxID=2982690 RepID=UPI0021D582AF|nr:hypothetical protein [Macrococcus sp. TMW 2.2395]MCU7557271.1 hypothetical protein [Macrococcus sp. TMW 2.2395]
MQDNILIYGNIAKVRIPYENEIKEVYAHVIDYNGRLFTQHGNVNIDPNKITYTFSDFETGLKIRSVEFFAFELEDMSTKAKATRHIVETFEKYIKPIIDKHIDKLDELKSGHKVLNDQIVFENGELQKLLDECN